MRDYIDEKFKYSIQATYVSYTKSGSESDR
jgi:hypothetical protein